MKIYIETYGCALNRADSNLMSNLLKARGHEVISNPDDADIIIVNTCTVRKDTELRVIKRIKTLNKLYGSRKRIIIAGCMVRTQPFTLKRLVPNASLISPQNLHKVCEVVESSTPKYLILGERDISRLPLSLEGVIAYVPIAEGCLGNCSFCITKIARRRLMSYKPELIIKTVSKLVKAGAKEIDLTAQDTGVYGVDLNPKWNLSRLVMEVANIEGDFMIRIGMANPKGILNQLDEFIEVLKHPKVFKFAHIPLQSGDDRVLKVMNRDYTVDDFRYLVKEIRGKVPNVVIATDIIVGHPGEDEEAFMNTVNILKELMIDRVHIAQYSIRPRTLSAALPQIPEHIKKERSIYLTKLIEELGSQINREYLGTISKVLVVKKGFRGRGLIGKLFNYKSVVLNVDNDELIGKWIWVRIKDCTFYDLRAEIIEV
ncbi:MAG: 2-methylthioadenine synthetase [Thermoprotei archaeon]|nr:MAG: 2-methylthioadenine synthetase [Thermoprotei archaeon]